MKALWESTRRRGQSLESGATATEYALLVSFIVLALLAGVGSFGDSLDNTFNDFGQFIASNI